MQFLNVFVSAKETEDYKKLCTVYSRLLIVPRLIINWDPFGLKEN